MLGCVRVSHAKPVWFIPGQQQPQTGARESPPRPQRPWHRGLLASPQDAAIMTLAGPAFVAFAADPLLTIIDTAFVGRLGAENLVSHRASDRCCSNFPHPCCRWQAALGVNTSVFSMAFVTFNFLAVVSTPLIASAISSNNKEQVPPDTPQHPPPATLGPAPTPAPPAAHHRTRLHPARRTRMLPWPRCPCCAHILGPAP